MAAKDFRSRKGLHFSLPNFFLALFCTHLVDISCCNGLDVIKTVKSNYYFMSGSNFFYIQSEYHEWMRMGPFELSIVTFELSFIMITCIFMVYIFVRRCLRLRHMKRRYMAKRLDISVIYTPSPRSSTLPLPYRDEKSSSDEIPSEIHQCSTSTNARKSNSLPIRIESLLEPTKLGFNGREILIWRWSRLKKNLLLQPITELA